MTDLEHTTSETTPDKATLLDIPKLEVTLTITPSEYLLSGARLVRVFYLPAVEVSGNVPQSDSPEAASMQEGAEASWLVITLCAKSLAAALVLKSGANRVILSEASVGFLELGQSYRFKILVDEATGHDAEGSILSVVMEDRATPSAPEESKDPAATPQTDSNVPSFDSTAKYADELYQGADLNRDLITQAFVLASRKFNKDPFFDPVRAIPFSGRISYSVTSAKKSSTQVAYSYSVVSEFNWLDCMDEPLHSVEQLVRVPLATNPQNPQKKLAKLHPQHRLRSRAQVPYIPEPLRYSSARLRPPLLDLPTLRQQSPPSHRVATAENQDESKRAGEAASILPALKRDRPLVLFCHDMANGYWQDFVNSQVHLGLSSPYTFKFWKHIDVFVYFSHSFLAVPPRALIDAAHRNGVRVLGTLIVEHDGGLRATAELLLEPLLRGRGHALLAGLIDRYPEHWMKPDSPVYSTFAVYVGVVYGKTQGSEFVTTIMNALAEKMKELDLLQRLSTTSPRDLLLESLMALPLSTRLALLAHHHGFDGWLLNFESSVGVLNTLLGDKDVKVSSKSLVVRAYNSLNVIHSTFAARDQTQVREAAEEIVKDVVDAADSQFLATPTKIHKLTEGDISDGALGAIPTDQLAVVAQNLVLTFSLELTHELRRLRSWQNIDKTSAVRKMAATVSSDEDGDGLCIFYDSLIWDSGRVGYWCELRPENGIFASAADGLFCDYHWRTGAPARSAKQSLELNTKLLSAKGNEPSKQELATAPARVFMGVDVWGRGTWGGGGFHTPRALAECAKAGTSSAVFAQGWTYESRANSTNTPPYYFAMQDVRMWYGDNWTFNLLAHLPAHDLMDLINRAGQQTTETDPSPVSELVRQFSSLCKNEANATAVKLASQARHFLESERMMPQLTPSDAHDGITQLVGVPRFTLKSSSPRPCFVRSKVIDMRSPFDTVLPFTGPPPVPSAVAEAQYLFSVSLMHLFTCPQILIAQRIRLRTLTDMPEEVQSFFLRQSNPAGSDINPNHDLDQVLSTLPPAYKLTVHLISESHQVIESFSTGFVSLSPLSLYSPQSSSTGASLSDCVAVAPEPDSLRMRDYRSDRFATATQDLFRFIEERRDAANACLKLPAVLTNTSELMQRRSSVAFPSNGLLDVVHSFVGYRHAVNLENGDYPRYLVWEETVMPGFAAIPGKQPTQKAFDWVPVSAEVGFGDIRVHLSSSNVSDEADMSKPSDDTRVRPLSILNPLTRRHLAQSIRSTPWAEDSEAYGEDDDNGPDGYLLEDCPLNSAERKLLASYVPTRRVPLLASSLPMRVDFARSHSSRFFSKGTVVSSLDRHWFNVDGANGGEAGGSLGTVALGDDVAEVVLAYPIYCGQRKVRNCKEDHSLMLFSLDDQYAYDYGHSLRLQCKGPWISSSQTSSPSATLTLLRFDTRPQLGGLHMGVPGTWRTTVRVNHAFKANGFKWHFELVVRAIGMANTEEALRIVPLRPPASESQQVSIDMIDVWREFTLVPDDEPLTLLAVALLGDDDEALPLHKLAVSRLRLVVTRDPASAPFVTAQDAPQLWVGFIEAE